MVDYTFSRKIPQNLVKIIFHLFEYFMRKIKKKIRLIAYLTIFFVQRN